MHKATMIVFIASAILPWRLRRSILRFLCGFKIDCTARISPFALLLCRQVELGASTYVGAFTLCKGADLLRVEESGYIGALNWITAFPSGTSSPHFALDTERRPQLIVERHAAITSRHLIDCTDEVRIGAFSTFAGFRSQILTHSIDLGESRQRARPVRIGCYCFVGTGCVLLAGSALPDRSILGARSLLTQRYEAPGYLYGGVPAKPIRPVNEQGLYFSRNRGYVD